MDGKKKRKNYFANQGKEFKRRKRLTLECGMKGFLCTCNFREKDCVREAYNLLNEYADKIYGSENFETVKSKNSESEEKNEVDKQVETKESEQGEKQKEGDEEESKEEKEKEVKEEVKEVIEKEVKEEEEKEVKGDDEEKKDQEEKEEEEEEEDEDISTALNKEIDELKAEAGKSPSEKKFQVVDTGVSNVIFIKSTVSNTLELVTAILKDLHESKKQKSRYLLRMLPIQVACKAYMDDIKSKANILFEKYFAQEPKTYSIVVNRHSNSNLQRSDVIEDLAQIITKKNPGNKANLKNPEIAVVVEIVRAICLISIAPNYFTYKKYNLLEICNQKEK